MFNVSYDITIDDGLQWFIEMFIEYTIGYCMDNSRIIWLMMVRDA